MTCTGLAETIVRIVVLATAVVAAILLVTRLLAMRLGMMD